MSSGVNFSFPLHRVVSEASPGWIYRHLYRSSWMHSIRMCLVMERDLMGMVGSDRAVRAHGSFCGCMGGSAVWYLEAVTTDVLS